MSEFFTWATLGTYAGAVLAVALITELIKGISWLDKLPTRIVSYGVAIFVLIAANAVAGTLTWAAVGLCVINAVVVALAANGGFDAVTTALTKPPDSTDITSTD